MQSLLKNSNRVHHPLDIGGLNGSILVFKSARHTLVLKPSSNNQKSNPQTTPVMGLSIQCHAPSKTQDSVAGGCHRLVFF